MPSTCYSEISGLPAGMAFDNESVDNRRELLTAALETHRTLISVRLCGCLDYRFRKAGWFQGGVS